MLFVVCDEENFLELLADYQLYPNTAHHQPFKTSTEYYIFKQNSKIYWGLQGFFLKPELPQQPLSR